MVVEILMIKNMKKYTIIKVILLLSMLSCDPPPGATVVYSYWVQNNSNKKIFIIVSEIYPDTSVPNKNSNFKYIYENDKDPIDHHVKLENYFASLPKDTLSIFFLSADTVAKYDWSIIQNNYNILKRVDFDLNYLYDNNKTIIYP
jgi:hypothetical protein